MGNNKRQAGPQRRTEAKGRNQWNQHQRLVLHLLNDKFRGLDAKTRCSVFNTCFKSHLMRRGLPSGLPARALQCQYSERNTKPLVWEAIVAEPRTEAQFRQRQHLTLAIKRRVDAITSRRPTNVDLGDIPEIDGDDDLDQDSFENIRPGAVLQVPTTPAKTVDHNEYEIPAKESALGRVRSSIITRRAPVSEFKTSSSPAAKPNKAGPQSSQRRKSVKTIKQQRLSGPTLMATPEQFRELARPPVPVTDRLAHPLSSGVLYRYWDEHSRGTNRENGFVAGLYDQCNTGIYNSSWKKTAPKSTDLDWLLVENHLNRREKDSPFISTSNSLPWILRLAAKRRSSGAKHGKVTLISTENLNGFYHVPPYWRQLIRQRSFTDAAYYYGGLREFLVWHEIQSEHIVCTFDVAQLFEFVEQLPRLGAILRLEIFHEAQKYEKLQSRLRNLHNELDEHSVIAIGKLCRFIGLTGASTDCLQHVLSDIIQGWKLEVPRLTDEQWLDFSVYWVRGLLGSRSVAAFQRQQQLHVCFLFAVKESLGQENMLHTADRVRKMQKKSTAVGLASPARICAGALQEAVVAVRDYDSIVQRRYSHALESLLPGIEQSASAVVAAEEDRLEIEYDEIGVDFGDDIIDEDIGEEITFDADGENDLLGL